jgi:hypothetical protein
MWPAWVAGAPFAAGAPPTKTPQVCPVNAYAHARALRKLRHVTFRGGILEVARVIVLLLHRQGPQVALHRRQERLLLRTPEEVRRDRCQDANDDNHDQQLDQREPVASLVRHRTLAHC